MYNLAKMLRRSCDDFGKEDFLIYSQENELVRVSFEQFAGEIRDWAVFLKNHGVGEGDRVGIITPKSPNQIRAFYACWWLGVIAVPICEGLGDLEMGFVIRDSEPKLILVDSSMMAKVQLNCGDIPAIDFSELPQGTGEHADMPVQEVDENAIAALIYTSGSTGMPKGVMLTHKNFYINARTALDAVQIGHSDSIMSLLPYWHSFALVVEVLVTAMCGAKTIVPRDKRDFKRNIKRYKPTIMIVVPRIADAMKSGIQKRIAESSPTVQKLFDKAIHNASRIFTAGPRLDGGLLRLTTHHALYDPLVFRKIRQNFGGKLRFFVSGGAPLDIEHQIFFKYIGLPIYQGYGLTESTPVVSTNYPEKHRLGSSGPVLPWLLPERGGDYTFRDEAGNIGKDLKGELLVKGDCVMKGYWRHTDASAKTLADGWLHTGDMAYVDDDGFLFIDGRQGNMIVLVGGEKLHPEHVEDAVKNCELVTEALVIGEKCKNVYVCVNLDDDACENIPQNQLLARVKEQVMEKTKHLAPFQMPKDVLVLPDLTVDDGTLTVTLKIRRHKVWEKYGNKIRDFLRNAGEEIATKEEIGIASSKIMESLGRE